MPLELWSAQYSLPDRDRMDITRAGVDRAIAAGKPAPGALLAPSAGLVFPTLRALRAAATEDERAEIWRGYKAAYLGEVRATYRRDRAPFDALLARERLVFACFCAGEDVVLRKRCHRFIAAEDVFAKLGAVYRGELRAKDAILVGAEEPPATLFGPERPCQTFMFTDGSGGGLVCGRGGRRKKLPPCATCGRPAPLLCDAPALNNALTCDAPICEGCAHTVAPDQHHCPKHATQGARSI